MLRVKASRETTKEGNGAFLILVREEDFDSVAARRQAITKYVTRIIQPHAKKCMPQGTVFFPLQLIGICKCAIIYDNPDDLPIDDVKCKHGKLIGFLGADRETFAKHPHGWKLA